MKYSREKNAVFFSWALVDIEARIILPPKVGSKWCKNNTEDEVQKKPIVVKKAIKIKMQLK